MSENNEIKDMKLDESMLDEVSGGVGAASVGVRDINPYWVRTTARSGLKCRLAPNGKVLKTYEYGHKLKRHMSMATNLRSTVLQQTVSGTDFSAIIPKEAPATDLSIRSTPRGSDRISKTEYRFSEFTRGGRSGDRPLFN